MVRVIVIVVGEALVSTCVEFIREVVADVSDGVTVCVLVGTAVDVSISVLFTALFVGVKLGVCVDVEYCVSAIEKFVGISVSLVTNDGVLFVISVFVGVFDTIGVSVT